VIRRHAACAGENSSRVYIPVTADAQGTHDIIHPGLQRRPGSAIHLAIRFAVLPPAVTKSPPAYRSPLPDIASAYTSAFIPLLKADQTDPSIWQCGWHCRRWRLRSLPRHKDCHLRQISVPARCCSPASQADHAVPSHLAIRAAGVVKLPPAYKFPPLSKIKAFMRPFIPPPTSDQAVPSSGRSG